MRTLILILSTFLIISCKTQSQLPKEEPAIVTEIRDLEPLIVTAPAIEEEKTYELPDYKNSYKQSADLLHTKLDVRFDWENEKVLGKATLTLKPYFYPTNELVLDAKGFEFHHVQFEGNKTELKYEYNGEQITIDLGRQFTKEETYTLYIDYTASPSASGGSAAITSDKGLYFINSKGEDPDKPMQIWTQGETEANSRWFPTIDKPIERSTQEIYITVAEKYKTLSNGKFMSSTKNEDGTRTDYWKMDQNHAPYLFMLAVGDYAVVEDTWEGMPLSYYVEPEYEKDAKAIFSNTGEMLTFFSNILGVKYPWPKYAQIITRDYVSGAMENTTAVIFGEFIQKHERELIDNHNELIIAHEMFHHWFGDLVTCESWSNLTLNEGFANYSEYLWLEHKYGKDAADHHMTEERMGYFYSSYRGVHPLIYFEYDSREDMFDAHSYNKGGAVLHMLRNYVGDDAFFASLNKYLTDNAYSPVEVHELRLAFEDTIGEDLNWFFNQWYLSQGHPNLAIEYGYDVENKQATLSVKQTQDGEEMPGIFVLPTSVDIYLNETTVLHKSITVNQREQTFTFDVASAPVLMEFDPNHTLLAEIEDNKTTENNIFQYLNAPSFESRSKALNVFGAGETSEAKAAIAAALKDNFWLIRQTAISNLSTESIADTKVQDQLMALAEKDPHSAVREAALNRLKELNRDAEIIEIAQRVINTERAYPVIGAALGLLSEKAPDEAGQYVSKLEKESNWAILNAVADIYLTSGDAKHLAFFEEKIQAADGFETISFFGKYLELAKKTSDEQWDTALNNLFAIATNMDKALWGRVAAAASISSAKRGLDSSDTENITKLEKMLTEIKEKETNEQLKQIYDQQF